MNSAIHYNARPGDIRDLTARSSSCDAAAFAKSMGVDFSQYGEQVVLELPRRFVNSNSMNFALLLRRSIATGKCWMICMHRIQKHISHSFRRQCRTQKRKR